ncbi:VWA domain-containing protein [Skermanella rosea]|uniref:nitric oxide reductase activation protein NorD n=1 Tax=Skermanella rosea TaxID=1817965 RepID=UPI001933D76D|nr:VWA domain-containing protein [Skermanella rosea]UEM06325.1 VWA domain-containing protein [Skermanella rosea]
MVSLFEPEETVGQAWHRLVGGSGSYRRHADAAVELDGIRAGLGLMFRALGGAGGVRLAACGPAASGHRLGLLQRIGLGTEKVDMARFDGATLELPARIDCFPDRADNEALYEWLVVWFACAEPVPVPEDPLQADVARLRAAAATTSFALAAWPGLGKLHGRLCRAMLDARPVRRLPPPEAAVDSAVTALLGGPAAGQGGCYAIARILDPTVPLEEWTAGRGYRRFLPVPLWGETVPPRAATPRAARQDGEGGDPASPADGKRRRAARRDSDQTRRNDPLMLNRFEKIIGLSEMVNINRAVEDDDEDGARKAAEDLDELSVGEHDRRAATKLRMELDLAAEAVDPSSLDSGLTYPEWDHVRGVLLPGHCRVIAGPAPAGDPDAPETWRPDAAARRRIRLVRRQFEALRPRRQRLSAQPDGDELDLSSLVRSVADRRAGGPGSDRLYTAVRPLARDLSVAVLVDVSLSTDGWIDGHRVLDVEKEALLALSHGLAACQDEHGIFTFTSRRREQVHVRTVKDFDEPMGDLVDRRIGALKPGHYTRIGAAVRHVAKRLAERPHHHRLLLLLSDGKPNDMDHYEGRYAIEDTRMAIREARRAGLKVFGVTVDEQARDYFPYLFGQGSFAIFPHVARLPSMLPAIYRQISCG